MLWGVVGVVALMLLVLYQLVRQHGRLLLRLEALERAAEGADDRELAVGDVFGSFRLPDLDGREVALEAYRGRKVLLVSWSPSCGFCDMIGGDLAQLEDKLAKHGTALVLTSYGDVERNRALAEEHGLRCPILLGEPAEFDGHGTPVAYLLDEQGQVAEPLAHGSDEVLALAWRAAGRKRRPAGGRSLADSRIVRDGLPPGNPAPAFALPDVTGRTVTLDEFRGRRLLLVFSDPNCGPCDALAPDLVELDRRHRDNNLAVVMVGRGDLDENLRKAQQHGFEFPVVVQDRWKLSKQYGIFATPVAFLIDEKGVIAEPVAVGGDAIRRLAEEPAVREE